MAPEDLAAEVRAWCDSGTAAVRPQEILEQRGWRLRRSPLRSGSRGADAFLIPNPRSQFTVVVDSETVGPASSARAAFLIAHEIGHSFFYDEETPPRRRVRAHDDEEIFCDQFALALLRSS